MNKALRDLFDFLKTPFPYFFLIAALSVSMLLINNRDFSDKLIKDSVVRPIETEKTKISFGLYHCSYYSGPELFFKAIILFIIGTLWLIFIVPSTVATILFMHGLQDYFANLQIGTLKDLTLLAFLYFTCNYWLLLSFLIKSFHDYHQENLITKRNALTIYSNVN